MGIECSPWLVGASVQVYNLPFSFIDTQTHTHTHAHTLTHTLTHTHTDTHTHTRTRTHACTHTAHYTLPLIFSDSFKHIPHTPCSPSMMLSALIVLSAIARHIFYEGEEVPTSQEESYQGARGPDELVL